MTPSDKENFTFDIRTVDWDKCLIGF